MEQYREDAAVGLPYREAFRDGLTKWIKSKQESAADRRRESFDRLFPDKKEELRGELIKMLGFPLTEYDSLPEQIPFKKIKVTECFGCTVWRVQAEVIPGVPFYGMYFDPLDKPEGGVPLVVACHGGSGTPEVVSGFVMDSANYNHMVERARKYHVAVFAPQLLMWNLEIYKGEYDRQKTADSLRQLGGSITALEITCIRRSVDALLSRETALNGKVGFIGLSYGGMYAVATAACDARFTSVYSSCWFNDRAEYNWADWSYDAQSYKFFDAEMAALIAPGALFVEIADQDPLFPPERAHTSFETLKKYYSKAGGALQCRVFSGVHELAKDDAGYSFFMKHLGAVSREGEGRV